MGDPNVNDIIEVWSRVRGGVGAQECAAEIKSLYTTLVGLIENPAGGASPYQNARTVMYFLHGLGLVPERYSQSAPWVDGNFIAPGSPGAPRRKSSIAGSIGTMLYYLLGSDCSQVRAISSALEAATSIYDEKYDRNKIVRFLEDLGGTRVDDDSVIWAMFDQQLKNDCGGDVATYLAGIGNVYQLIKDNITGQELVSVLQLAAMYGLPNIPVPKKPYFLKNIADISNVMMNARKPEQKKASLLYAIIQTICASDDPDSTFEAFAMAAAGYIKLKNNLRGAGGGPAGLEAAFRRMGFGGAAAAVAASAAQPAAEPAPTGPTASVETAPFLPEPSPLSPAPSISTTSRSPAPSISTTSRRTSALPSVSSVSRRVPSRAPAPAPAPLPTPTAPAPQALTPEQVIRAAEIYTEAPRDEWANLVEDAQAVRIAWSVDQAVRESKEDPAARELTGKQKTQLLQLIAAAKLPTGTPLSYIATPETQPTINPLVSAIPPTTTGIPQATRSVFGW